MNVAAGHCLATGCRYSQAPDSALPLCFRHRDAFQRSDVYARYRELQDMGHVGRAVRVLVDWLEVTAVEEKQRG